MVHEVTWCDRERARKRIEGMNERGTVLIDLKENYKNNWIGCIMESLDWMGGV